MQLTQKWFDVIHFFFFQAEDGIRDIGVTGVQTCALPIWSTDVPFFSSCTSTSRTRRMSRRSLIGAGPRRPTTERRSEERRVGKECRFRWSTYHLNKNILRNDTITVY